MIMSFWSWEENKRFELALAVVDEQKPDRWQAVAEIVGGKKSAEDVEKHYLVLLEDLQCIESGEFDHTLVETHDCSCVNAGHNNQYTCRSDQDHEKLLAQVNIN